MSEINVAHCERARLARDPRFDGEFFTAVKTTGIFCRPICPAPPPQAKNVTYYATAALALEAGYRPCLRCRPETAPHSPAWQGTQAVAERVRQLIRLGYLHQYSLAELAQRLGLSQRHIHRLCVQYFAVSPNQLAQSERLLKAKALLTDSNFSITEIAFAAGFNSVRRFNELIQQVYQRPPSELRKQWQQPEPTENLGLFQLQLYPQLPYDFSNLLAFFRLRAIPGLEQVTEQSYIRYFCLPEVHQNPSAADYGWYQVSFNGKALQIRIACLSTEVLPKILAVIKRQFDVDCPIHAINECLSASHNSQLQNSIAHSPGLRLPGAFSLYEAGVRAILGQQISIKGATTLLRRIVQRCGQPVPPGAPRTPAAFAANEQIHLLPDPQVLAQADLNGLGLTGSRIQTLKNFAQYVATHPDHVNALMSPAELESALLPLKGIGPWTVQYLAMRGLSYPDAFPASDLVVLKALQSHTLEHMRPSVKQAEQLSAAWRPWRSYATLRLWHSTTLPARDALPRPTSPALHKKAPQNNRPKSTDMTYYHIIPSPMGDVLLLADEAGLHTLLFQDGPQHKAIEPDWLLQPERFEQAVQQLQRYFSGEPVQFDFAMSAQGTAFQQQVWQALRQIPHGETRSYQDIANAIGNPKAVRAVAAANAANPIGVVVPCHRVIGKNGKLTGYAGGLDRKRALLQLEEASFKD